MEMNCAASTIGRRAGSTRRELKELTILAATYRLPDFSPEPRTEAESLLEYGRRLHRVEMQRLKMKHRSGLGGTEVVRHRSRLMDYILTTIWNQVAEDPHGMALVALGGYGRNELAPFSDVDLMFLISNRRSQQEARQIQAILCLLWDMGLQVGHSVRTIKECLDIANEDLVSLNAMLDARFLLGQQTLADQWQTRLHSVVERNRRKFAERLIRSVAERHASQGGTAFVQEPDVKEAQGGLRDFHTIGWIVKSLDPDRSLKQFLAKHRVSPLEWRRAEQAYEFLQRVRNEMHFLTNRRTDVLSHNLLNGVAKGFQFKKDKFEKDSEAFLKYYYLQVRRIAQLLNGVMAPISQEIQPSAPWFTPKLVQFVSVKSTRKKIQGQPSVPTGNPAKWMHLFRLSQANPRLMDHVAKREIRQNALRFGKSAYGLASIGSDFRAILRNKGRVAQIVRQMHELGFLGRVLPEFGRLTCQVQQDRYHKYTTDEHTLRALEVLDQIALTHPQKFSSYQKVFNEIHDSSTLYFAMLMHDTGKGMGGGHSAKGAALALKALQRLGFDPDEAEKARTLVQNHLLMGHVSQRRNLDDPHTIESFLKIVGRLDTLNMLLLLTYADAQAVAPGVWTDWKDHQLWELYHKAYDRLMFTDSLSKTSHTDVDHVRKQVLERLNGEMPAAALNDHFRRLPEQFVLYTPIEQIVEQLRLLRKLDHADVVLEWVDHPDQGFCDLILVTRDRPGLFAQIAGGLSAFNLSILSAQLNTRSDGIVFDVFRVGSLTGEHRFHPQDYVRVEKLLSKVISGQLSIEDYLKKNPRPSPSLGGPDVSFTPRVRIDNGASPTATVIEVQAGDRIGLGYQVAKTLASFQLNIVFAKLATEKSYAFDVFYVNDANGRKVVDRQQVKELDDRLRAEVLGLARD